jgi:hypothetical protein
MLLHSDDIYTAVVDYSPGNQKVASLIPVLHWCRSVVNPKFKKNNKGDITMFYLQLPSFDRQNRKGFLYASRPAEVPKLLQVMAK